MRQIYITLGESVDHTSWVSLPVWYYSAVQGHTQPTTACRQVLRPYHDERASLGVENRQKGIEEAVLVVGMVWLDMVVALQCFPPNPSAARFISSECKKNKNTCLTLAHTVHLRVTPFAARFDTSNLPYI